MSGLATTMALMRGLHLAATVSLLGTAGFIAWMLPAASVVPDRLHRWLSRLRLASGLIALLAGIAWFTVQAAIIADADSVSDVLGALPLVAGHTRYGTLMMLRLGLLGVATGLAATRQIWGRYPTLALAGIALGLQGMVGHAGATVGAIGDGLVLSESLHLLAAGLWLGALFPLWLALRALSPSQAAAVCQRFSPIGLACVLVLAGTGFAQGVELIGGLPALFGTGYGLLAMLKIALFLLALMLAAYNRLWLTDRLAAPGAGARRRMLLSVGCETCIGLVLIAAAAFMASSLPAAHSTPVWPFSWQFSLITVKEDPDFRREVVFSLLAIGAAVALMVAALLLRWLRPIALAILVLALMVRGPSLALLTKEAYPTSFQTSPTDFATVSIARGQTLFARDCADCHGPNGDGRGPSAAALRIKPADLTMPHIWAHTDGEMFWWLTHGVDDPEGGLAMPGFENTLSADDRWALIDYIRAHSAGVAMQRGAASDLTVRAPALPVTCVGVAASNMADLLGHTVYVVTTKAAAAEVAPQYAVTLHLNDPASPTPGACVAADPTAWNAYAVLANLPPEALAGTAFLVDSYGWLRAINRADSPGGWHTTDELIAALNGIHSKPIQQPTEGQHEHHH